MVDFSKPLRFKGDKDTVITAVWDRPLEGRPNDVVVTYLNSGVEYVACTSKDFLENIPEKKCAALVIYRQKREKEAKWEVHYDLSARTYDSKEQIEEYFTERHKLYGDIFEYKLLGILEFEE